MAETNYSKVDEYGFEIPKTLSNHKEFFDHYIWVLSKRAQRWQTLSLRDKTRKSSKLKRFIRKGIPMTERSLVWMYTSGAETLKNTSAKTYAQLRDQINDENIISMIKLDIPRTFPENIFFTKDGHLPLQLYNVCATFAHQNSEVTYCQGLNYIAGLLLIATKDEETSFWLLKVLVEHILPKYYIKTMSGLLTDLAVLDELVQIKDPQVHAHICDVGVEFGVSTTKWFICLFAEVLPTETVFRIWDCLFYEGSKILFRVALTLIMIHRAKILKAADFGDLVDCFKKMGSSPEVLDCHTFMQQIFITPGSFSNSQVEKLRTKHANAGSRR